MGDEVELDQESEDEGSLVMWSKNNLKNLCPVCQGE